MIAEHALAEFLKEHREAAGLNHRQFAEAITKAGGKASTQAVQQWENTDPEQRTTRPSPLNRIAIAEVLGCDHAQLEAAYATARNANPRVIRPSARNSTPGILRVQEIHRQFEHRVARAMVEAIPDAHAYFQRSVTLFDNTRQFDYLSPNLAADWVFRSHPVLSNLSNQIETHLWRLLWLSRIDEGVGVKREYLLALILLRDPERRYPDDYREQVEHHVARYMRELQMLKLGIRIVAAEKTTELIDCMLAYEVPIAKST
ncbi:helix-turn-helix transcriptional regulator [Burkholderia cenocepacia]|uniref:helix-turn-helix domain-containing protein n=1 Tax=Burkholderia cepacia complex TaxID=87882 RepID=UPI000F5AE1A9|nr:MULTISPECIES: helix-turn-helix transcriptional regulator [Burkholderia cepacia complex]MBR8073311.1 helix-turn-helix transcriptional regulator [Burkholderia cenocepacia]